MLLTILGSNSATPAYGRHPTSILLEMQNTGFLLDCGEGTQMRMNHYNIRKSRIKYIFISHLHGDHYFGLPGLLTSYGLNGRRDSLDVYGPPKLQEILRILLDYELPYPLNIHSLEEGKSEILLDTKNCRVKSFPVFHSVPTHGFLFIEKQRKRRLNLDILSTSGIPKYWYSKLCDGEDYEHPGGQSILNEEVTLPGLPEKIFAYAADTAPSEMYYTDIQGVDVLYHESTYIEKHMDKAVQRGHSTAKQAAGVARQCGVKKLLIGHFSARYKEPEVMLEEARPVFPNTFLATEGERFSI